MHIGPPSSLEECVQEVGKAGRSGMQSYAYLFYYKPDISDHRSKRGYITKPSIEYWRSNTCLEEHLLQHFGFKFYCCGSLFIFESCF